MTQRRNDNGFTLVELMTAMAFVAFLLLAIAGVVIQMSNIYNKGVIMASVNQAGRAVVSDMKRTVGEGQVFDPATAYYSQNGPSISDPAVTRQQGGRFCTGAYTYVWNIGTEVKTDSNDNILDQANKYDDLITPYTPLRFVRLRDVGGQYCAKNASGALVNTHIKKSDATEMFADSSLMVQCFHINRLEDCDPTSNTPLVPPSRLTSNGSANGQELYSISMLISNADKAAIDTVGNCKEPSQDATYQNYCAVNEFDFTVHTGNNGG